MKKLLIFALSMVVFISCEKELSDTVDQDKIFASYVLDYNGNQDITYARANFHFSNVTGTKLELAEQAQVTIDGEIIPFKPLLALYEKEFIGVKTSGNFYYIDVDGNEFNNTVTMVDSIDFPTGIDTLSRTENFELTWIGSPVGQDEVVTVVIVSPGLASSQLFTQTGVGATNIMLTQDKLQNLVLENAQFTIRRSKNVTAQEVTSAGGNVIARFNSSPMTVYIKP